MESILALLDKIEDILEESRGVPFSNKVSVDKESIYEVIDEIRLNLPDEIRSAKRVATDSEKIISEARLKAQAILREAENHVDQLIAGHEITKLANEHGAKIVDDSKKMAREMNAGARAYADEILEKTEESIRKTLADMMQQMRGTEEFLNETIDIIYSNRQELRSVPPKKD